MVRPHLCRLAAVLSAIAVALVALAVPSFAGETPPPAHKGWAAFDHPAASIACTAGVPRSLTFSFTYSATHLVKSYKVTLGETAGSVDGSKQVAARNYAVTIKAGKAATISHTFALSKAVRSGWQFYASADDVIDKYSSYSDASRAGTLSCKRTSLHALVVPKVTVGKVSCSKKVKVTFDGRRSNVSWSWVLLFGRSGFSPSPPSKVVKPGRVVSYTDSGDKAGSVMTVRVSSQYGSASVGQWTLRQGCSG